MAPKFVLVMGPTGVGKSNFIDKLLGGTVRSGTTLKSVTSQITPYRDNGVLAGLGQGEIIIIDTPGFDDTSRSDHEILQNVADWMENAYTGNYYISAIIYLHRITDNRVGGASMRNLRMFGKLTGESNAQRVWMVTTMWDNPKLDQRSAKERQLQLETTFWKPFIDLGAQTYIFKNDLSSARTIIQKALQNGTEQVTAAPLLLQEETAILQRRLEETAAGKELYSDLQRLLQNQKDTLIQLQKQASQSNNEALVKTLNAQLEQIEADLEKTFQGIEKLKISFIRKIILFFSASARTKEIQV